MKDKEKLTPLLNAFAMGHVDFDYAMDFILHTYSVSNRFNWRSFGIGVSTGVILAFLAMKFLN